MLRRIKKFIELEAATGILLIIFSALALILSNSNHFEVYQNFLAIYLPLDLDFIGLNREMYLRDWINDASMALFFLFIGLELKQEVLVGELSTKSRISLPLIAAVGGIIVPAIIFYFCNSDSPKNLRGFAIPTATDIAFAYGIVCLFGNKISKSLKVFLISLAMFDDLVAIFLIAIFYSKNVDVTYLALALIPLSCLAILNLTKSHKIFLYLIVGVGLWLMILESGIHATLSGVVLAMFIPLNTGKKKPLETLIRKISPSVNFLILPVFAFANAGVRIENFSLETFLHPITLGVILGLFFGKQIGVMIFSFVAVKSGITHLPRSGCGTATWKEFYGITILTGVGFTMGLFIGVLAFPNDQIAFDAAKIGVLFGSFFSAIFGMVMIRNANGAISARSQIGSKNP